MAARPKAMSRPASPMSGRWSRHWTNRICSPRDRHRSGLVAPCDPLGLRRAILNLVFNARDALDGNGTVRIAARRAGEWSRGVRRRSRHRHVAATIARVFDPFFTTKS
jgi:signal transduction histidine kinase